MGQSCLTCAHAESLDQCAHDFAEVSSTEEAFNPEVQQLCNITVAIFFKLGRNMRISTLIPALIPWFSPERGRKAPPLDSIDPTNPWGIAPTIPGTTSSPPVRPFVYEFDDFRNRAAWLHLPREYVDHLFYTALTKIPETFDLNAPVPVELRIKIALPEKLTNAFAPWSLLLSPNKPSDLVEPDEPDVTWADVVDALGKMERDVGLVPDHTNALRPTELRPTTLQKWPVQAVRIISREIREWVNDESRKTKQNYGLSSYALDRGGFQFAVRFYLSRIVGCTNIVGDEEGYKCLL